MNNIMFPGYVAMTGELIQQISRTGHFSLRRVVVKAALVMQDSKSSELMTSLRAVRLTYNPGSM